VQLHENIDLISDLDVNIVAVSVENVKNTKILHDKFVEVFPAEVKIIPFLSDPDFKLIEPMNMRHDDVAYRGYGIIGTDGQVIYSKVDDYWGDNIEVTFDTIRQQLNKK
jgi:alkyl hydroperoxide reductase subunit AhpC